MRAITSSWSGVATGLNHHWTNYVRAELGYAPEGKPLLFYRGGYGRFDS